MSLLNTIRRTASVAGALVLAAVLPAAAEPVFGPTPFVKTDPGPQLFTETFATVSAGGYALWVLNGDEAGRVPAGTIAVNGVVIVSEADFRRPRDRFWKPVGLLAGENTLTVRLLGDPGGYITVAILPVSLRPDAIVGRLVLPWGTTDPALGLALKNGSHAHARLVKVNFYDPSGALVATSSRFALAPRASRSTTAAELIETGSWSEGSIEVFYAGLDGARLFATASISDPATAIPGIVVLPQAGARYEGDLRWKP